MGYSITGSQNPGPAQPNHTKPFPNKHDLFTLGQYFPREKLFCWTQFSIQAEGHGIIQFKSEKGPYGE